MLHRFIALLFAFLLSAPTFAAPGSACATAPAGVSQFDAGVADESAWLQQDGSSDERPLDDQPGPSQSEGAMDSPALMMTRPDAKAPALTMSRPRPYAMTAWRAPYLDGPQRPPCAAFISA